MVLIIQQVREIQFTDGMNWNNRDKWHIDHVRPIKTFNVLETDQLMVCFNWRNLRPLWWDKNINKKDKYDQLDEENWTKLFRNLGYEGDLFLLYNK